MIIKILTMLISQSINSRQKNYTTIAPFLSCIIFFYVFLLTSSRSSRFSPSRRFSVDNSSWNPSSRRCLHMSTPHELSVLYFNHYSTRYLHNFPNSFTCYSFEFDRPPDLRQKSVSVAFNIRFVTSLIG